MQLYKGCRTGKIRYKLIDFKIMKKRKDQNNGLIARLLLCSKITLLFTLMISGNNTFAQDLTVSGSITNQDGSSMIGVNIMVKGTTHGTVTDIDGQYSIMANKYDTLLISYIGFLNQEIPINGRRTINIELVPDLKNLDEVVVVGYGVQKKSDVTGSVASIDSEDLERMKAATIDQAMQGQAAGVRITSNSGTPGAAMSIRVRGTGTINDSEPLYVVDGMPVDNISFLSPSNIASMEILKDAASCAIYGARGANGVVIITTKKGKEGTAKVQFSANYSLSELYNKIDLASGAEFAMLRAEALRNGEKNVPDELKNFNSFGEGTDWQEEITRKALTHNHALSFSGGTDKLSYYLSLNNINQQGIVKKTDFNRTSLRINTSLKANKWLTIGENITIENRKQRTISEGNDWDAVFIRAINFEPTTAPFNDDGSYAGSKYTSTIANPIAQIENTHNKDNSFHVLGNIYTEIKLFKGFVFKSDYGINHGYSRYWNFNPIYFVKVGDENAVNSMSESYSVGGQQNWTNYFTYNNTINGHDITLMAGNEIFQENYTYSTVSGVDLVSNNPDLATLDNLRTAEAIPSGSYYQSRRLSYMGRLNYAFKNKYLAQINYRIDGSSNFAEKNRYGKFPSFSVGWKISEEPFMESIYFMNRLKLRAGWGKIGNDRITPFAFYSVSQGGRDYVINNENVGGTSFPRLVNHDIRWESTVTTNVAIDASFLDNQITLTADYYHKKTTDMLIQAILPGHVGTEQFPWANQGSMLNKGFEVELGYKNSINEINFNISGNLAYNNNEVIDLGLAEYIESATFQGLGLISRTEVGMPVASFYGYIAEGLFQNQAEIEAHSDASGNLLQPKAQPGDIKYADADGDGVLDKKFIGNPLPDFTYGLNIQADYRNFDFTLFLQGTYGNEVFNTTRFYTNNPSARYNLSSEMVDRWMVEGSTNNPNTPRMDVNDQQNAQISDRFIEDGSYLRIKNLQLGYTLPESVSKAIKIQSLRVYVGVNNLFTFTKYTGLDPEVGIGIDDNTGERNPLDIGIDRIKYPQPRTYLMGFSVNF